MLNSKSTCLPRVELGSIAQKASILTVRQQTLFNTENSTPTFVKQIQV